MLIADNTGRTVHTIRTESTVQKKIFKKIVNYRPYRAYSNIYIDRCNKCKIFKGRRFDQPDEAGREH